MKPEARFSTLHFLHNLHITHKLCLFLAGLYNLVHYKWVRLEPTLEWSTWKILNSGNLRPFSQALGNAGKYYQEQTLLLIGPFVSYKVIKRLLIWPHVSMEWSPFLCHNRLECFVNRATKFYQVTTSKEKLFLFTFRNEIVDHVRTT
jgi:hypothetical protein